MIYKDEPFKTLYAISKYIIEKLVMPISGIGCIDFINWYIADVECFSFGDDKKEEKILSSIENCFKLKYGDITNNMPLALISLYIMEKGEYKHAIQK